MSTKTRAAMTAAGSTLVEALIATGITGLLILVLMSITMFSGRAFAAFYNYVDLDDHNKIAMDTITSDLRECNKITAYTSSEITI
jgi:Tfp pilus assembly protein PilW